MRLRPIASGAFVIAVLLVMLIGVAWAAGAAYSDVPDKTELRDNESFTADVSNYSSVPALAPTRFYDNESFYQDGTELDEGTDYAWNTSDGTVKFRESGTVDDNRTVNATYAYETKVQPAQGVNSVISLLIELALPLSVFIAVAVMLGGLAAALVRGGRGGSPTRNFGR
jgi:hypothetical protein